MASKSNKDDFLLKLSLKFPDNFDKYDYSKFEYINNSTKSTIICKIHGEFEQSAAKHLSGRGCRVCQYEGNSHNKDSWLTSLLIKYPDRAFEYDYGSVDYQGNLVDVVIGCKKCGYSFNQTPRAHREGHGCPKCSGLTRTPTLEQYLEDLFKKFPENKNLYDYSKVQFRTLSEKTEIFCKMCNNVFVQPLTRHKLGAGCTRCNMTGRHACVAERDKEKFLKIPCSFYLMSVGDFYKYGISSNLNKRVKTISRQTDLNVDILFCVDLNMYSAIQLETYVKLLLRDVIFTPENKFGGYTECFKTDVDLVSDLIELVSYINIKEGDNLVNLP